MKNYFDFSNIKGDLFGGLTAGIVALPLALAFGVSSGLGPSAGLYGAIFVGFFAALFGGTQTQISGPTAPMTAVSMVIIAGLIAANDGDVSKALPAILMIFILAGLIQIGLGLIGLGKYIKYMPYPVVSGFMSAIGIIILLTQIAPAIGYYPKDDTTYVNEYKKQATSNLLYSSLEDKIIDRPITIDDFKKASLSADQLTEDIIYKEARTIAGAQASGVIGAIKTLPRAIKQIKWLEFILALCTIVIIFGFKCITKKIPSTLVALIIMTGIAYGMRLDYMPIKEIPSGLPKINFNIFSNFSISSITPYIFSAITLALLGTIDSLLTSVVADNMTKTRHKPNKELVGQGIGNTIGALFGGLPGAGATIRTVVNINAGGKTRISGMIASVVLLIISVSLAPVASQIPAAVLAGILITVGINVIDYKGFKAIPKMPISEIIIMLTVLILSATWNLVYAVGIGLIMASIVFMKNIGDIMASNSKVKTIIEEDEWDDESNFPKELIEEVSIKHLEGPLFFGSTTDFHRLSSQIPDISSTLILRMERVPYMDQSGMYAIEDLANDMKDKNKTILLTGLQSQPRYMLERINLIPELIGEEYLFDDFGTCQAWVIDNVKNVV